MKKLERRCEAEKGRSFFIKNKCIFTDDECQYRGRKSECENYRTYVRNWEVNRERI